MNNVSYTADVVAAVTCSIVFLLNIKRILGAKGKAAGLLTAGCNYRLTDFQAHFLVVNH